VGAGQLAYTGTGTWGLALAGSVLMGLGLAYYFAPALALIQRVAGEALRGRVTSVFGVLQEGSALVTTLSIAALAVPVSLVAPTLVGAGALLVAAGTWGVRASLLLRRAEALRGEGGG
jgi:hypothetical protein